MQHLLDQLAHAVTSSMDAWGIWAVLFLMILESACIPVPSEVIMLYGGALVYTGDASFLAVVAAGVAGNVIGSLIMWAIGRYGGRTFLERHGKWVHISHRSLERGDEWFERYGNMAVFFGRMLPVIRTFISLPAGIAEMPIGRFTLYTTLGCIPWVIMLTWIGYKLGPHWEKAHSVLHYGDYVIVAAIIFAAVWVFLQRRTSRTNSAAD